MIFTLDAEDLRAAVFADLTGVQDAIVAGRLMLLARCKCCRQRVLSHPADSSGEDNARALLAAHAHVAQCRAARVDKAS